MTIVSHHEVIILGKAGYLKKVYFGFQRNGEWIEPTLIYTASEIKSGNLIDDDPGRIDANANVEGAIFQSYLFHSESFPNNYPTHVRKVVSYKR